MVSTVSGIESAIDLREIFRSLWQRRWLVIVCMGVLSVASAIAAFTITPIYRASVVLIPASSDRSGLSGSLGSALGQLGGLASLAGVNVGGSDASTEEALAVLKSRQFTEGFIVSMKIMPALFHDRWDENLNAWRVGQQVPSVAEAYKYFAEKVRFVQQDKKTGLVTVHIEWTDRALAASWANDLVRRLNLEMQSRSIEKAKASIHYLENELAETSVVETREAINRLIEAQVKQRMLANVSKEYAFRVVDPAMVPDFSDKVRPNKSLIIVVGFILGLVLGVFAALLRAYFAKQTF